MVLGITGISGVGKHTVAGYLQRKGWTVLDADAIAHYLYRPYTNVWKEVVEAFGEGILNQDDVINRSKLGKIVFDAQNPEKADAALRKLNGIVHPYVRRRMEEEIHHFSHKGGNIAVVAALWKELDLGSLCDKILLVRAESSMAIERVCKRDNIGEEMCTLRIKKQSVPPAPDWTVENNGTPEELYRKMGEILKANEHSAG